MKEIRSLKSTGFNETVREDFFTSDTSASCSEGASKGIDKDDSFPVGIGKEVRLCTAAKEKAYRLLSYRDRTSHEIVMKLKEKEFSETVISTVVSDLKAIGVLDDKRFAEQWMRYQIENRYLGPFRLKVELKEKGYSPSEVARLLECLSGEWDPVRIARRALLKRYKELSRLEDLVLRRKAFSFLQRKGFSTESILSVFRDSGTTGNR